MENLITLLTPLVQSYYKRRLLREKIARMTTYIMDCGIDSILIIKKINKIKNLNRLLDRYKEIPVNMHYLMTKYLEHCWVNVVRENGFVNIEKTIKELGIDVEISDIKKEKELKTLVRYSDYEKNYKYNIKPINCSITKKILKKIENEKYIGTINILPVRPSLPETNGKLYGICVEIDQETYNLKIFGLIDSDVLRLYRKQLPLNLLYDDLKKKYDISKEDGEKYVNSISYRDLLVNDIRHLTNRIKHWRDKHGFYKNIEYNLVLAEYEFLMDHMRIDFVSFLLEVDMIDLANYLYKQRSFSEKYLDWELQKKINVFKMPSPRKKIDFELKLPYEFRISAMKADDKIKSKAYEKLKTMNNSMDSAPKAQKYLDGILKIPFGVIKNELDLEDSGKSLYDEFVKKFPSKIVGNHGNNYLKLFEQYLNDPETNEFCKNAAIKLSKTREKQQDYLNKVQEIFEKSVHGHELVKTQLKRLIARWMSGGQSGIVIGLEGPPGNGKTTLIKKGLANCLVDQTGKPRPVGFIPLGGSTNASSLVGHGYTYQGSNWGRIVDILMDCECMNPIFLFDELDKVSKTENGIEIMSILTHLTDKSQNNEIYDKYFEGVPLDISKSVMVFTFNDRRKIDPILLDRMTVIETNALTMEDKKSVTMKHLIPEIAELVDIEPEDIKIGTDELETLICDYTFEAGARQLKRILENLIQELNLRRLCDANTKFVIDHFLIKDVLKHINKIRRESISMDPLVGQINGMYANTLGIGGILPIQVDKSYTSKNLLLTGTQGDTMKESMRCAETIAINLVTKDIPEFNKEELKFGLHIHCPSTGMPKDGPSAGIAICIAIYSYLTNKYINQDIAVTGEIDLLGKALPIGGVEAKLVGSKKAGIKTALIPKENEFEFELMKEEGRGIEDENFKVVMIANIYEALPYFIKEKRKDE